MKLPAYRPSGFQCTIQRIAMLGPISAVLANILPALDRAMLALSGGRQTCTGLLTGLPTILVTTRGARSGEPRTSPLVAIIEDGQIILVASNFGRANHPAWYYNLRADPRTEVRLAEQSGVFRARLASGEEARRCLVLAEQYYPGYGLYQKRAAPRQIEVFVLREEKS